MSSHNTPATDRDYYNLEVEQQDFDLEDPESADGELEINIWLKGLTEYGASSPDGTQRYIYVVRESTSITQDIISCTFDLEDFFERPHIAYAVLIDQLTILENDQRISDYISRYVISFGRECIRLCDGPSDMGFSYLRVIVELVKNGHVDLERRAMRESIVELERRNNGRVAASEEAVKRLLKSEIVDDETDISCPICLEELRIGSYATAMPCSHLFHGDCITCWLEESHYCPLCRFEMPTD